MEAPTPSCSSQPQFSPNIESIKRTLLKKGVYPAPKTLHALRKKQIQKHKRKLKKTQQTPPLTASQKELLDEESHFQTLKQEYKDFTKALNGKSGSGVLVGKPWERIEWVKLREIGSGCKEFSDERLKRENLRELMEVLESDLKWVLEDDVDTYEFRDFERNYLKWGNEVKQQRSERDAIQFLVNRLSKREVTVKDWKLAEMMKQAGLRFSEGQLLKILEGLSHRGKWKQAMAVVEWVYNAKQREDCKSRFVYTKLLSILGKERRPREALEVFNLMLEDCVIYPDMAAYHSIAVTLGQAGHLKELMKIIECMGKKPSKRIKNMLRKNWDPSLAPDLVIYNAVLNACILASQWKGVYWVFQQLRKNAIKPNGATYGLAMEVMLHSGKYELVYEFFRKMNKAGEAPKAVTYKVLVRSFWKEGKVIEAMKTVRDMEQRGVVGTASVYYELACCLCNKGRWQDAMMEVEKMKRLHLSKPLEVTFTGMILSSMDGRHINDCISIFEYMKAHCVPNIGTVNIMLKVYGRNGLFSKAKELFEEIKWNCAAEDVSLRPDEYTYSAMLETSASALQWDYFESVYKELAFDGYCLDQSKHALLLVEASRAGKGHLLEHAFDRILEAGEIPFPILFIEMVFQSTAREDYDRAVTLVNTMALGSLQVSQSQWTALLKKHKDRISQDGLEKLLDAICVSGMTSEVTVSNLLKSLQLLCHSGHNKGHTI